jgi:hypothetical protein
MNKRLLILLMIQLSIAGFYNARAYAQYINFEIEASQSGVRLQLLPAEETVIDSVQFLRGGVSIGGRENINCIIDIASQAENGLSFFLLNDDAYHLPEPLPLENLPSKIFLSSSGNLKPFMINPPRWFYANIFIEGRADHLVNDTISVKIIFP